jgi:hypothetical protein
MLSYKMAWWHLILRILEAKLNSSNKVLLNK